MDDHISGTRSGGPPRSNRPDSDYRECSCPERDGKTYHQRGTCTDPVVARLDWYADSR